MTGAETPRKRAFAPVVGADTRVLVLGSLPGEASLAAGQYYANPRNLFWHLTGAVIGRADLPALPYEARLSALLENGIGMWDTIATAVRRGSLDSAIRSPQPAALEALVVSLPALRAVAFNGGTSARIGRRALAGSPLALIDLPSSSPAHAVPLESKQARWLELARFLA